MDGQERSLNKFAKRYDNSCYNTQLNTNNNNNFAQSGGDDNPYFTRKTTT